MSLALLIPAYNAARLLPDLLSSAANQTHQFDEIWVYDDASTDDTAGVATKLGANVVRGDLNRGCTFAKSALVERTQCDWVHFHDADDLLEPDFVQSARAWLSRSDVDVIVFGCEERWRDTGEIISLNIPDDAFLASDPVGYVIKHKINVNGIAPGVIDTPMWDHVDAQFAKYENLPLGEKKRQVGLAVPYGRMGTPEDMVGAAVFLASQDADYIVAQTLNVDGGNWMS